MDKTHPAFSLQNAFKKYDSQNKGYLYKTEFKCAFIFLIGMRPNKDDMQVIKQFMNSNEFRMDYQTFVQIIELY